MKLTLIRYNGSMLCMHVRNNGTCMNRLRGWCYEGALPANSRFSCWGPCTSECASTIRISCSTLHVVSTLYPGSVQRTYAYVRIFEYWMHCMHSSLFLFQCFELASYFSIMHMHTIWIASVTKIFECTIYSVAQWPPMHICMYVALLLVVSALKRG